MPLERVSEWREGELVEYTANLLPRDHPWSIECRKLWAERMANPSHQTIGLDANGERVERRA